MSNCTVLFQPDGRKVRVAAGTDLRRAAALAGIELKSACGGEGTCGSCVVKVLRGRYAILGGKSRQKQGLVLACRTAVLGDLEVEVPALSRLEEHRVLLEELAANATLAEREFDSLERHGFHPVVHKTLAVLDPPTLTENASDLTRLLTRFRPEDGRPTPAIGLRAMRQLPLAVREGGWRVTATVADVGGKEEILRLEPGSSRRPAYGLAIDIGTTSCVVNLVDMRSGLVIDRRGAFNRQARYGDDVITRIIHATEQPEGLQQLNRAVLDTLNDLVDRLLLANDLRADDLTVAKVAGNTTMAHLFLSVPPDHIRREPYIPAAVSFPVLRAGELGLTMNKAAPVFTFPAVASYVGGDIVAGVLVTGMAQGEEVTLFIDIGTNGEIVLGNRDWLVACACSAGPCFEGGGITCGMRATPGAVERIEVEPGGREVRVRTVGGLPPAGICGSGLVDAMAALYEAQVIDRVGNFRDLDSPRLRGGPDGPEFVLAEGPEREIVLTGADLKNLIRAKGAVYAGIRSLLAAVQLPEDAIARVFVAGGFGNYLNLRDAVRVGMLPDLDPSRYHFVGNSSVKGARLALLSRRAWAEADRLARQMTYLELSASRSYMEEFVSALFLPHTDLSLFPSVTEQEVSACP
ncbi:MAG: ASKHA domain-containing protein [bacterium]|nr:ASKHA domain-containing protein [bacterium]